jgi:hypothetical protein
MCEIRVNNNGLKGRLRFMHMAACRRQRTNRLFPSSEDLMGSEFDAGHLLTAAHQPDTLGEQ